MEPVDKRSDEMEVSQSSVAYCSCSRPLRSSPAVPENSDTN